MIAEVIEGDLCVVEVVRDFGIGLPDMLLRWVIQARPHAGIEVGPSPEELAEVKWLRTEVADLQCTIEILKAATSFSSMNSTVDLGEYRVYRGEPSPLARRRHVRCAWSR